MTIRRLALAGLLALACLPSAQAQPARVVTDCALASTLPARDSTALMVDQSGRLCTVGSGTTTGSITAPGTSGSQAQAVQGINGGVPVTVAQVDGKLPWGVSGGSSSGVAVLGPGGTPATIDGTNANSVIFQVPQLATGATVVVQRSTDGGTTWTSIVGGNEANAGASSDATVLSAVGAGGSFRVAAGGLLRVNQTAWTSGTTTVVPILSTAPFNPRSTYIGGGLLNATPASSASAVGPTPSTSTGSALVAKSSPGNLYGFSFTQGAGAGFLALVNATAAPAGGAAITPLECVPVAANAYVRTRQDIPDRFTTGIVLLSTSSCTTYTAVTPVLMEAVAQ